MGTQTHIHIYWSTFLAVLYTASYSYKYSLLQIIIILIYIIIISSNINKLIFIYIK